MSLRKYHQANSPCPLANSLDILGDHWSLLIVRDLLFMGKHEYKELLNSPEGISTNILSNRLLRLQQEGLILSQAHPASKKRKLYYLTERGKSLFPVLIEITRWGLYGRDDIPSHLQDVADGKIQKVKTRVMQRLTEWEKRYLGSSE